MVIAPLPISQGEIWWADLGDPIGSEAAYRRPIIILQCDAINQSRINTIICVPLTSNLKWAHAPGNVKLPKSITGLDRESVANVSLIVTIDKAQLIEQVGKITDNYLEKIFIGFDVILGR